MKNLQRLRDNISLKRLSIEADLIKTGQSFPQRDRCLLLDTSGSMSSNDDTGRRKIESLAELIQDFPHEVKFAFNDNVCEVKSEDDLRPEGPTYLGEALSVMHRKGKRHIILITDGRPTEREGYSIEVARLIERLDIIYVGPEPAPKLLEELARAARSGSYGEVQLGNLELAGGKVRALLR